VSAILAPQNFVGEVNGPLSADGGAQRASLFRVVRSIQAAIVQKLMQVFAKHLFLRMTGHFQERFIAKRGASDGIDTT